MTTLIMPPELRAELERADQATREAAQLVDALLLVLAGVLDSLEQVRRQLPPDDPSRAVVDHAFAGIEQRVAQVTGGGL